MENNYDKMFDIIRSNNLSSEEVLQLFTNWHGTQLLTNDFFEFIEEEGCII